MIALQGTLHASRTELIDTLWNVNVYSGAGSVVKSQELIDTLWNVNFKVVLYEVDGYTELIDTLWNVNSIIIVPLAIMLSN